MQIPGLKKYSLIFLKISFFRTYFIAIFICALFIYSIYFQIYLFLKPNVGILNAYLIDQLFFLALTFFIFLYGLVKKRIIFQWYDLVIFVVYIILLIQFQNEVLPRYFIKEDYSSLLKTLNNSSFRDIYPIANPVANTFFTNYPFLIFALSFKFFKYNAFYYNLTSLVLMAFGATMLYKILSYLNYYNKTRNTILSILISGICFVSPTIMETYVWIVTGTSAGYTISGIILSGYFYLKFIHKKSNFYFILSYLFLLFLLKSAFTRAAFGQSVLYF